MRSLFALIRKDLKGYLDQPTGYILLVVFAGVVSYMFFFTPFGVSSEASTRNLFTALPWLLMVFVPASTMRLLAEEQRDGTLEILLTQPIQGWVVLLAKFLAGFAFVSIFIFSTIGIPIALATAGNVDVGAIIAQYIGSLFLAASFVAIGLFTSSLTRNQIVAFILGLFFIAALLIVGLDVIADGLPNRVSGLLQTLSPVTHFSSMARGVIDLRDVLYFIALVSTLLSATYLSIRSKSLSHRSLQYRNLQLGVVGLIIFSLLIGWFGSSIGGRLDLTEDKLFTMSPATSQILSGLDDLLTVELFQSKDPPAQVSLVTRSVNDFLEDFAASSGGNVKLVRKFPDEDDQAARKAQLIGVPQMQFNVQSQGELQIKTGYLGLSMTYADRREVVPFISSIDGFEYRISSLAFRMIQQERKRVTFLRGHGEKTTDGELRTLASILSQQYEVTDIEPAEGGTIDLNSVDVLIIAGPTQQISDEVRASISSYIDGGGKAMILVDTVIIDPQRLMALPNRFSFADFVGNYGVVVDDTIAFDVRSYATLPFGTQGGSVAIPFPYWMRVPTVDSKVAGEVESVVLPWASTVGFLTESTLEKILLLETTPFGAIDYNYRNNPDVSPNSQALLDVTEADLFQSQMAVAVTGPVASSNGSGADFRVVVVGDSDWITDTVVSRYQENIGLALNLVDWLAQEDALASIRSKVTSSRQLLYDSPTHKSVVQYGNLIGVPALLIVIGLVRFIRRRNISQRVYSREE
ncbi:MAG: Gldg family protein [Chloroflexi bacterium]|nr:Gldg family protein [Chloroflexota bacterium]